MPILNATKREPSLVAGQAVEIDRQVQRDGHGTVDGEKYQVGAAAPGLLPMLSMIGHPCGTSP